MLKRMVLASVSLVVAYSILAAPAIALAPATFQPRVDIAVGDAPFNAAIGDVNSDGKPDMVVPNAMSNTVTLLLNNGSGGFTKKADIPVGTGPVYVVITDFNGDKKTDIGIANETAWRVTILMGDGTGAFPTVRSQYAGGDPDYIGVGHLNGPDRYGDYVPDLVLSNFGGDTISILLGQGMGWFDPAKTMPMGNGPTARLADLNKDGWTDVVSANYFDSTVTVRLGDGVGGFGALMTHLVGGSQPIGTAIGDLNRDGRLDLAVGNYGSNSVSVLLGTGGGGFSYFNSYTCGIRPTSVCMGDMNGDGLLDVATSNYGANSGSVLLGNGVGGLEPASAIDVGSIPWGAANGDANGDGRSDLFVTNTGSDSVSLFVATTAQTQPLTGSAVINGGAAFAKSTAVTLGISATGNPTQMMVANEPTFAGRSWQTYSASSVWNLTTGDGAKTVYAKLRDAAGTESQVFSASIQLDTVAPVTSRGELPTEWINRDLALTLGATDAGSGVASTGYKLTPPGTAASYTAPVVISREGATDVEYWSTDKAGNVETAVKTTVRIDKTAPTTTSDAKAEYYSSATIRLTPADALSGISGTRYSLDGGAEQSGVQVTVSALGSHTLTFYSTDTAGNREASKSVSFRIAEPDSSAPATSISGVPAGWTNTSVTFSLSAVDSASGVAGTNYRLTPPGSAFAYTSPVTISQEGATRVDYWSTDRAGNVEGEKTATVRIDKTAPNTSSDVRSLYTGSATIRLTATDALSGVASTVYSMDGGPVLTGTQISVSSVGVHTVTFYSTDAAGNREASKTATFRVTVAESNPPTTTISPLPSDWVNTPVMFSLSAVDDLSGVATTYYRLVPGSQLTTYTAPVQITASGTTRIEYQSVDWAGNWETVRSATVRIDRTPPVTTSDAVNNYSGTATIRLFPTDPLSGVATTYYELDGRQANGTTVTTSVVGWHSLWFWSVDRLGNAEKRQYVRFQVRKARR